MSSTVAVGLYLATWSDADGGSIFPGVERTASDLGVSESTVKRALRALKAHGWITEAKAASYRQGRAAEYRLTFPGDKTNAPTNGSPVTSHQIKTTPSSTVEDSLAKELTKAQARKERARAEAEERLRRDLAR